jgi:beta-lactamase regulating signal transducer with metallopeptidase domain
MKTDQLVSLYLTLNFLIVANYFVLRWYRFEISARGRLKIHYLSLCALIAMVPLLFFIPNRPVFEPAARVWSAQSMREFSQSLQSKSAVFSVPVFPATRVESADAWGLALRWTVFLGLLLGLSKLFLDIRKLFRIRRESHVFKRLFGVTIAVHDSIAVPLSYRIFTEMHTEMHVVIPLRLIGKSREMRLALAHEIQHHRQGDTAWVYILSLMRLLFAINPVAYLWSRTVSELQEFACDEALLDHGVDSLAYASCLIEVAQTAALRNQVPACATGMAFLQERKLLKRRIEYMFKHKRKLPRSKEWLLGALVLVAMTGTAAVSRGLVQDRRISMEDARQLVSQAKSSLGFPVMVNELVLAELNRFVGTPDGRAYIREATQEMEKHRSLVQGKIDTYKVPIELMAVPIVESKYRNLRQDANSGHGAGLWMFIKSTARHYGLRVNSTVDERLDIALETDAAMRYLKGNYLTFNDWLLALMAYNVGESRVEESIRTYGTRDAWELVRNGVENDSRYLAKVMAAVLIMNNPALLK